MDAVGRLSVLRYLHVLIVAGEIRFLTRRLHLLTTERFDQMLGRIMHPVETYRRRAERAERNFENARDPAAQRFAQAAAQRWRALAELAQHQETDGPPIPHRFRDASEAMHYAQDHKFALYWKGTHAFAKRQSELGEHFVVRPVITRKGPTYVGLVPLDEQEKASEKEPS